MRSFLNVLLALICVHATLCRRIDSNEYEVVNEEIDNNGNYDDDDDIESERSDGLEEEIFDNRIDEGEFHESVNDKKVLASSAVSDDERRKAYKRYLKKLEQVKSQDDFDRVFKIKSISFKRQSISYAQDTPCTPKDATVPVQFTSSSPSEVIYPLCIPVKRCGGCCQENKECVATTTQNKQTHVRKYNFLTGQSNPYTVNYVDDTACGCQCKRKASECSSNQVFDSTNCRCNCATAPQQCGSGKQWSTFDCACVCSNHNPACPTDHKWNKSTCQCDVIYYPTCNSGKLLNQNTCTCN